MNYSLAIGVLLFTSFCSIASGGHAETHPEEPFPDPRRIVGLSMDDVSHMPGIRHLFDLRAASQPPTIANGEPYRPREVIARFHLDATDSEVLQIARQSGAESSGPTEPNRALCALRSSGRRLDSRDDGRCVAIRQVRDDLTELHFRRAELRPQRPTRGERSTMVP